MPQFNDLAVSGDGRMVLREVGNEIQIINTENQKSIRNFNFIAEDTGMSEKAGFLVGKFSNCGKYVLLGKAYYTNRPHQYDICLNIETGLAVNVKQYNSDDINLRTTKFREISYSHDARYLVSMNPDESVILTEVITGKPRCTLLSEKKQSESGHFYYLEYCYFSSQSRYLVVYLQKESTQFKNNTIFFPVFQDKEMSIIDVQNGKNVYTRRYVSSEHLTVEFSPQEECVLVSVKVGSSIEWELIKTASSQTLARGQDRKPLSFMEHFYVSHVGSDFTIMNLAQANQPNIKFSHPGYLPTAASISPNGKYLAIELEGDKPDDKEIVLYRIADGKELFRRLAFQFVFANDSNTIVLLSCDLEKDYYLRRFQTVDGKQMAETILPAPQLSLWIKSLLSDNRVFLGNGHQTWTVELCHPGEQQNESAPMHLPFRRN